MPRLLKTLLVIVCVAVSLRGAPSSAETKALPARPRTIRTIDYAEFEPQFLRKAGTLDPRQVARTAWKGYLSRMGGPWGMTADLKPMMRLYFEGRALPWTLLATNQVDGFDVNTRNVGAHAALHAMLGVEKADDPVEKAQLAYILSLTPEGEGSFIVHGEIAENLLDLYAATGDQRYKEWAGKVIAALKPPYDSSDPMGGWLHLHVGWNVGALAKWSALTGDKQALAKAITCADRVCKSRDPDGDDGAFRSDGSFGGRSQATTASWHMHGHTHILPGLVTLGEQLAKSGQEEKGLAAIGQARRTFDWLYDPERNADAGSMTGWLGEWLMCHTGWDRQSDCEGCTMGDVVETAVALAAASRLYPSLSDQAAYYDRAEQIYRGQVSASIYRQTPPYLALLHEFAEKRAAKGALGAVVWHDQSPNKNDATLAAGDVVKHATTVGKEQFSALTFDGAAYLKLADSARLRASEFAVIALVDVRGDQSQTIYANYDNPINWGKGVNLAVTPDRHVTFFTTDGTEAGYDPLTTARPLEPGFRLIVASYGDGKKEIVVDGEVVASAPAKPLDYGAASVASVGALREFGQQFRGELVELVVFGSSSPQSRAAVSDSMLRKYGLAKADDSSPGPDEISQPLLWLQADEGYERERPEPTPADRAVEAERLYQEAVATGKKFEGRLLGLCGFGDWVNKLPATLDPSLPGIDMMGCCSDAIIRASGAVWKETVTGDAAETRVNMAFNRDSPLVDVASSLPHRGEVNVTVKAARRVLVRVPDWAPKEKVRAFVDRRPVQITWEKSYVVFPTPTEGEQLTVIYPLRIAEVKETVGSLDGAEFTERWRGDTIVDISPRGRWLPTYVRPELESEDVPSP